MTTVSVRDIVSVCGGGTPRRAVPEYYGGDIPWVTPKDMKRPLITSSEVTLTQAGVKSSPAKLVPAGSVLVVVRSGVLKHTLPVALSAVPVTLNQDMKALIPTAAADAGYLTHLLKARQPEVLGWVRATTAHNFPIDKLLDLKVDLPPLDEQRRIAAILYQADELRAKRHQYCTLLDDLAREVFQTGFLSVAHPRVEFGSLITEGPKNGMYRPSSDYGSGTPILRIDSFGGGMEPIDWRALKRLRATPGEVREFGLHVGDIVINRVNAVPQVGKSALVTNLDEPTVFESNMMRVRLDTAQVSPEYVSAFLQTDDMRAQIAPRIKRAVNQASINQTDVRAICVPLPPLHLQREFAARVQQINAQRAAVQHSLATLDELFASLQSRAFSGQL